MQTPDEWKKIKHGFGRAFVVGLFLEVLAIGTGYCLYREYKTNEGKFICSLLHSLLIFLIEHFVSHLFVEFRDQVNENFPQLTDYFGVVSGLYLKVAPTSLQKRILDPEDIPKVESEQQSTSEKQ